MGYFDSEENVNAYIAMADGYDGADLIALLRRYLPEGSSVLELGMGPGKDLDLLRQSYRVTGSDISRVFLDRYKKDHPEADLLLLDATSLDTDRTFDCIYSNKVLHHLSKEALETSLRRQKAVLNDAGMLLHSFWYGTGDEEHHGLRFTYYTEPDLRAAVCDGFDIVALEPYKEMNDGDSLYILLRKTHDRSAI